MSVLTVCRLADPFGQHLATIADYTQLDYVLNCSPGAQPSPMRRQFARRCIEPQA